MALPIGMSSSARTTKIAEQRIWDAIPEPRPMATNAPAQYTLLENSWDNQGALLAVPLPQEEYRSNGDGTEQASYDIRRVPRRCITTPLQRQ